MPELRVRHLDAWIFDVLRDQARKHGWSMEREIQQSLSYLALRHKNDFLAELQREHEGSELLPDSTPGIRAERDAL